MFVNRHKLLKRFITDGRSEFTLAEILEIVKSEANAEVVPAIFHEKFAQVESKEIERLKNKVQELEASNATN